MSLGIQITVGRVFTKDAVHVVDVGVIEGGVSQAAVAQAEAVVSLLVLTPADVADKAGVVVDDALATKLQGGGVQPGIAQPGLVDLGAIRVGDDRILGLGARQAGSVVVALTANNGDIVCFNKGAKAAIRRSGKVDTGAQC